MGSWIQKWEVRKPESHFKKSHLNIQFLISNFPLLIYFCSSPISLTNSLFSVKLSFMRFDFLWEDWCAFCSCLKKYFQVRVARSIVNFEIGKDHLVNFLLTRRGVHTRSFLNTSIFMLLATGVLGGPIIANTYPGTTPDYQNISPPSAVLGALTTAEGETQTIKPDRVRDSVINYEIQAGDTLSTLAEKFGVSVDTIKWANNLKGDSLTIGEELKIPPVTGIVHKVKPGDTIYSLAQYYKTDAQKILNFPFNDFADLDTFALDVGQTLIIPDGVMPQAKAIVYTVPAIQSGGGSGEFLWPVGGAITQYPVWYHNALDIADPSGPGVAAAGDGVVSIPGFMPYGYGNYLLIDHGNGLVTLYAHLQAFYVSDGESVSRGQIIGREGSTGRSTGTHLHFEVRKNGAIVNPLPYLK